jgi:hypothetical protein
MILPSRILTAVVAALAVPMVSGAQTCLGLAPFSTGRVQIGATGDFGNDTKAYSGSLTFGSGRGAFGGVFVGTVSYDAFDENTTVVGGSAGWQVPLGTSGRAQLCPGVGVAFGFGPNTIGGSEVNLSSQNGFVGLQAGIFAGDDLIRLVPTAGVALVYSKVDWEGSFFGGEDRTDLYGLIDLGVGIVVSSRMSIRPSIDIPVGLEGADPSLGIMVAINFGRGP